MAGYKINKLSLKGYFEQQKGMITSMENWQHKTDEIVFGVQAIAPEIPLSAIRNAFVREKKKWMAVDEETFAKNFEQEEAIQRKRW